MTAHFKTHPVRFCPLAALFLAASAAGAVACSGQDDTSLNFESESAAPVDPLSFEEREAEFQSQFTTPLSPDEMIAVETALRESEADMTEVRFVGRMVAMGEWVQTNLSSPPSSFRTTSSIPKPT
jgi:hypothetical protein